MTNEQLNIERAARMIMLHGPNRVLISADGDAVPSAHARELHGVEPTIIFIRNDGWSLGAPAHLEWDAFQLWAGAWTGFMRKPEIQPQPINQYKP
jgi:hypothetical protein